MSAPDRSRAGDGGGIALFTVLTGLLAASLAVVLVAAATGVGAAAARARTAADAAALAAAGAAPLVGGDGDGCRAARRVAQANGARVVSCRALDAASPLRAEVTVAVRLALLPGVGGLAVRARAAAAVVPDGGEDRPAASSAGAASLSRADRPLARGPPDDARSRSAGVTRGSAAAPPAAAAEPAGTAGTDPVSWRRRPAGRRALTALSAVMLVAGAALLGYPLVTDVYADQVVQSSLEDTLAAPEFRERYASRTLAATDPLTRIVLPDIAVDAIVVAGTTPAALRAGAGHYPSTPLPGEDGNVAIAGHRSTYGRPFRHLDALEVDAEIRLETPVATHVYRVVPAPDGVSRPCASGACWITHARDWEVVAPLPGAYLTLTTCHPVGSAQERLILRAELVDTVDRVAGGAWAGA